MEPLPRLKKNSLASSVPACAAKLGNHNSLIKNAPLTRGVFYWRALTYDAAGLIATDSRSGGPYTLAYNNNNRLKTVTVAGTVRGTYTYNGFEQLITRVITNSGTANATVNTVQDLWGNVIAELDATGATVREYIWLPEAEIAPTRQSRTQVDIPLAVVDAVTTATPVMLNVHADHLGRPVKMTNSAKASVWDVTYTPWGAPHTLTGAQTLNERFPGQWFQLESGLHYNWHRHYDPSLGRYTQPDPLGFVDGPSVYAYAGNDPIILVDEDGQIVQIIIGAAAGFALDYIISKLKEECGCPSQGSTAGAAGNTALGAAEGTFGPYSTKSRTGIAGGLSGPRTSVFSEAVGGLYRGGSITLPTRNTLRTFGAGISRVILPLGIGLLARDIYDLSQCLNKK